MAVAPGNIRRARPLLGTFVEICARGPDPVCLEGAVEEAFGAIARVHLLMSFQDVDSDVNKLNRQAAIRETRVDSWTYEVLEAALDLYRRSCGIFDVTAGPSFASASKPKNASSAAVELLPDNHVRFHGADIAIDLSGIAKGAAVDRAIAVLKRHGIPSGLVNAGGDLAVYGAGPFRVHIRDPRNPSLPLCAVDLENEALASSGGSFNPFQSADIKDSAVIDPGTQAPVRAVAGVSVRARSCMEADALAKVVMIAGEGAGRLLSQFGAEALVVSAGGPVSCSGGWGALDLAA
jgi:FAD:protein FMN transferase